MSLNELLLDTVKPWCNIRVNNISVDGYPIPLSGATGLTGGHNSRVSQGGHQYGLSGFTGGATVTLGSVAGDGQVLDFVVDGPMVGACTLSAGSGIVNGNILGLSGGVLGKSYTSASNVVVGTTASVGDYFEMRSANNIWSVNGIVRLASAYT